MYKTTLSSNRRYDKTFFPHPRDDRGHSRPGLRPSQRATLTVAWFGTWHFSPWKSRNTDTNSSNKHMEMEWMWNGYGIVFACLNGFMMIHMNYICTIMYDYCGNVSNWGTCCHFFEFSGQFWEHDFLIPVMEWGTPTMVSMGLGTKWWLDIWHWTKLADDEGLWRLMMVDDCWTCRGNQWCFAQMATISDLGT